MKKQFVLFLMFFTIFSLISQNKNWRQINTPYKTAVELVYQASNGILFGSMTESNKVSYSLNNGQTWVVLNETLFSYPGDPNPFKEDKSGTIFFFSENKVYYFVQGTMQLIKLIEIDEYESIKDMAFLYNGDIVVGHSRELLLYSALGTLKRKLDWGTHTVTFLVSPNANGTNYVVNSFGASYKIKEFSVDLNFVGNERNLAHSDYVRIENRIFSKTGYSDDGGITWNMITLSNNYYTRYLHVGSDLSLYYIGFNNVFKSIDRGNTFIGLDLDLEGIQYIASTPNNIMVAGTTSGGCNPEIYISLNGGADIQKIINDIGYYHTTNVSTGIDENLFMRDCQLFQKQSTLHDWKIVENQNSGIFSYEIYHMIPLSNGEIIGFGDFGFLKSKDKGESWVELPISFFSMEGETFKEKNGNLYFIDYDSLKYSLDFGESWNSTNIDDPISFSIFGKVDYSDALDLYFYDFFDFSSLVKYSPTNQVKTPINFLKNNEEFVDFSTSFEGKDLYILSINWSQQKLYLYSTHDDGQTFDYFPVGMSNQNENFRLKIDHLDNVYVFSEKRVLISSDRGASWADITPEFANLLKINDLQISYDNYIYLATTGMGILKYNSPLAMPNVLIVKLFDDTNKNCQRDSDEPAIPYGKVVVNGNYIRSLNHNGEASFLLNHEQNIVSVLFNDHIYASCEEDYDITLVADSTLLNIPLITKEYCTDLSSSLSVPFLRRCFDNVYHGQVTNEGNIDAENTEIKITLDPFFDFIESNLPVISQTGNELILSAGNLTPGTRKTFYIKVNLRCDAVLGQEHCISSTTETTSKVCEKPAPRVSYLDCQENIGSYDPNDKAIFVNGIRDMEYLEPGDKLEYMIRFQNTGTDTAFTVKIMDPISSKFDIASIQPVAASHNYTWSINNGNLEVIFNHINLLDSFKNEPESHGFIKFEITLNVETILNQEVKNHAGIFFDFNEPIITNEVVTPVGKPSSVKNLNIHTVMIYPNPSMDFVHIKVSGQSLYNAIVYIFDERGAKVVTTEANRSSNDSVDVSFLPSGIYVVQIVADRVVYTGKFIKH